MQRALNMPKHQEVDNYCIKNPVVGLTSCVTPISWWKELEISSKHVKVLPESSVCIFCRCAEDCSDKFGEFLHHSFSGMNMHYFCLLLASGLTQSSDTEVTDDFTIEKSLICGFEIKDIITEVNRASRLRCVYCHKFGASIGCVITSCKSKFHYSCARDNGVLSQFYQNFRSYCVKHRPKQTLKKRKHSEDSISDTGRIQEATSIHLNESRLTKNKKSVVATSECPVCLEAVQCSIDNFQSLTTPCCGDVWLHRSCVQQQAHSSGLHFFRCPVCNDVTTFTKEMQRMGIFIPERDASWELAQDAFNELLQRHSLCDKTTCYCPHGRDYNLKSSKWEVVLCDLCGSSGTHISCDDTVVNENSFFACQTCVDIHGVDGARQLARQMGIVVPAKPLRRSPRLQRCSSSVESPSPSKRPRSSQCS